jgi:hypothetical protein
MGRRPDAPRLLSEGLGTEGRGDAARRGASGARALVLLAGAVPVALVLARRDEPEPGAVRSGQAPAEAPPAGAIPGPIAPVVAAPRTVAPTSETSDPARPARAGSERHHYELHLARLRAAGAEGDGGASLVRLLDAQTTAAERVGLLRASWDAPSPVCEELFRAALAHVPDDAPPEAESVPAFALRALGERLDEDPIAREILERALFPADPRMDAGLRRRAIARLVAGSSGAALAALERPLAAEADDLTRRSLSAELARHPDRAEAERLVRALRLPPPEPPQREEN